MVYAGGMALYTVQNILHANTGLPADDVVNTFSFETNEGAASTSVAAALNGHVAASYVIPSGTTIGGYGAGVAPVGQWLAHYLRTGATPTVKAYDADAPGSPLATSTWAGGITTGLDSNSLPAEVALCLSFQGLPLAATEAPDDADADSAPERPQSRRRGRVYIGPLSPSCAGGNPSRPQSGVINSLLKMAKFLRNPTSGTLTAVNAEWGVISRAGVGGLGFTSVDQAWVDDEFDTQRRRGLKATSRTTLALP